MEVELVGLEEQVKALRRMMTDDPGFRKRLTGAIRKVLSGARKDIQGDAGQMLRGRDPRKAYKAVRSSIYKRILGGQVNILNRKKAGSPGSYQKPRKGYHGRGGNRWGVSEKTRRMEGYEGADRGFVLRFLNAGTEDRKIHSYTDRGGTRHSLNGGGNRGHVGGNGWFSSASERALRGVYVELQALVDQVMRGEFK